MTEVGWTVETVSAVDTEIAFEALSVAVRARTAGELTHAADGGSGAGRGPRRGTSELQPWLNRRRVGSCPCRERTKVSCSN